METGLLPMIDDTNIQPTQIDNSPIDPPDQLNKQPAVDYQQPVYMPMVDNRPKDIFADMDKTTIIIIFVVFILGFFMGKTMQPVVLKSM